MACFLGLTTAAVQGSLGACLDGLVPLAWNRTRNLTLTKGALCHWSYSGLGQCVRRVRARLRGGRPHFDGLSCSGRSSRSSMIVSA